MIAHNSWIKPTDPDAYRVQDIDKINRKLNRDDVRKRRRINREKERVCQQKQRWDALEEA